jgi:hypothetical protein
LTESIENIILGKIKDTPDDGRMRLMTFAIVTVINTLFSTLAPTGDIEGVVDYRNGNIRKQYREWYARLSVGFLPATAF